MGIDNLLRFEFMSPPPAASMTRALELLYALGALDDRAQLTVPLGVNMAEFPLPPPLAKMVQFQFDRSTCESTIKWGTNLEPIASLYFHQRRDKEPSSSKFDDFVYRLVNCK